MKRSYGWQEGYIIGYTWILKEFAQKLSPEMTSYNGVCSADLKKGIFERKIGKFYSKLVKNNSFPYTYNALLFEINGATYLDFFIYQK